MIKKANYISQASKKELYFRVTATLLNSWSYIWNCADNVVESENDTICIEDKIEEASKKAEQDFLNVLYRIPTPDNENLKRGREYENLVCSGGDEEFSPIIANGSFQVTGTKKVIIDGTPILLYGILDVLKAGRIMDIKSVLKYKYPKYKKSHQHSMYLYLFPEALDFTYLVSDGKKHYYENYIRENCEDILQVVSEFISWLKSKNLFEVFTQKWAMYI